MHGIAWASAACAGIWIGLGGLNVAWAAGDEAANNSLAALPQPGRAASGSSADFRAGAATPRIGWRTLTRSLDDRVIEYAQFGQGESHTLVVAPLAGDEMEGMRFVELLASHLAQFPRSLDHATVTIVRDPNPDGRFRRSPGNARGVLIDQNFPTRHWRRISAGSRWLSGREPESETETRALMDLLEDLKPQRIVILGGTRRAPILHYAGPAEALAGDFSTLSHIKPLPLNAAEFPGSLAAYAGHDHHIPTLVFRLSARSAAEQNWLNYKRALMAVLDRPAPRSEAFEQPDDQGAEASTAAGPEPRRLAIPAMPVALQSQPGGYPATETDLAAPGPRELTLEELEQGAPLVPVGRPPEPATESVEPGLPASPGAVIKPNANAAESQPIPQRNPYAPRFGTPQLKGSFRSGATAGHGAGPSTMPAAPRALYVPPAMPSPSRSPAPAVPEPKLEAADEAEFRPRAERLPPIDDAPPLRDLKQEPIPFYPGTGY